MKKLSIFFMLFVTILCSGQVNDNFSDGNFTENPVWTGSSANFTVNATFQLQSSANKASNSYLFTPSEAFDDAQWECTVRITYNPTPSNYALIYLASDRIDPSAGGKGYYVQIGGTNDEVSLFVQDGTKKTKIIDGADKRVDNNPVEIRIKVTRDLNANFKLYSKLSTDTDFLLEGETQNTVVASSSYFGLAYANTSTTGTFYYFDDVVVTGKKAIDLIAPVWKSFTLEVPDKLHLVFSEPMDFSKGVFTLDQDMGLVQKMEVAPDQCSVTLTFGSNFERGKIYRLETTNLTDLAGNALAVTVRNIGITEKIEQGDLVINELMFENPEKSVEYLEIYNRSDKLLDIGGLVFTTRKTDGSLNTGNSVPAENTLLPNGYVAFTEYPNSLRNYHACPPESTIIATGWSSLNNDAGTVVICNSAKDTIYDELSYSAKWHHILVKNPKGVALERIHPDLPTQDAASWHSAASEVNYGTPGYKNSQYRDLTENSEVEKTVWLDPESFSPDNDGIEDVCFIRYRTEENGFVANVQILNAVGNKVYRLASNVLLSAEGFLSWDGRTDNGKLANPGIYVLYFEMINPQTGRKKHQKLPIVISAR